MGNGKSKYTTIGWLMFTLSGVLFLVQAIRLGDWMTGAGAIAWLIGVALFLIDG